MLGPLAGLAGVQEVSQALVVNFHKARREGELRQTDTDRLSAEAEHGGGGTCSGCAGWCWYHCVSLHQRLLFPKATDWAAADAPVSGTSCCPIDVSDGTLVIIIIIIHMYLNQFKFHVLSFCLVE